jgi:thymidylate synthase
MMEGYKTIVDKVILDGLPVSPRGESTLEVPDFVIRLEDPTRALAVGTGRKLNLSIAAAEAAQIIGGFLDPLLLVSVSKNFEKFMDDGTFWGGYGLRVKEQVVKAAQKLVADNDTRQAVVTIWDPNLDNVPGKHDYPCTLSLTFQIREERLQLHTTMRSNDVWLGLPYDIFMFTQLQLTVARALGIEPGPYFHHAVSLHLYTRDLDEALKLKSTQAHPMITPQGFGHEEGNNNVFGALMRARDIGLGFHEVLNSITESEKWYITRLNGHTSRSRVL